MDIDAVSTGTGRGQNSESRICCNCGKLGRKDLEVPRVYVGLRTLSTAGHAESLGTMHEVAEASQLLVKVRLVKDDRT